MRHHLARASPPPRRLAFVPGFCVVVGHANCESHSRGRGRVLCSTASFTELGFRVAFCNSLSPAPLHSDKQVCQHSAYS